MQDFQKLEKDNLRNSAGNMRKYLPNKKAARLERLMRASYQKYQLEIVRPSVDYIEQKHATTTHPGEKFKEGHFLKKTVRDAEYELFASFQQDKVRKNIVAEKSMWLPRKQKIGLLL